jgi:hypothetical protein
MEIIRIEPILGVEADCLYTHRFSTSKEFTRAIAITGDQIRPSNNTASAPFLSTGALNTFNIISESEPFTTRLFGCTIAASQNKRPDRRFVVSRVK